MTAIECRMCCGCARQPAFRRSLRSLFRVSSSRGLRGQRDGGGANSKTDVDVPEVRVAPVAGRAAHAVCKIVVRAAAQDAPHVITSLEVLATVRWIVRVSEVWFRTICAPETPGPLPNVAAHLFNVERAASAWKAAHGAGRTDSGFIIVGMIGRSVSKPGEAPSIRPARRFLPLGFARQRDAPLLPFQSPDRARSRLWRCALQIGPRSATCRRPWHRTRSPDLTGWLPAIP